MILPRLFGKPLELIGYGTPYMPWMTLFVSV